MCEIEKSLKLLFSSNETDYRIAANTGITAATIGNYRNGKTKPTKANAMVLINYFTNFLTEEEENNILNSPQDKNERIFTVPLIPIEAVAGFTGYDNGGIRYEDCEKYTVPEFKKSGVEFLIRVSGSSMYPKYSNGDILACRKVTDVLFFQWGKVYVIDSSQGQLVKRIYEDEKNPDNIILISDNKEKYPPHPMPKSDIRSLSIVLGVIRME